MSIVYRPARVNVKFLIIIALAFVFLTVAGLVGHRVRKQAIAQQALRLAEAAFETDDFTEASKQYRQYLSRYLDDAEVLNAYAESNLSIEPATPKSLGTAIAAYRRLRRLTPEDETLWKKLAKIYAGTGQHNEAAYVCRRRLEEQPKDFEAIIRLGRALYAQRKLQEAYQLLSEAVRGTTIGGTTEGGVSGVTSSISQHQKFAVQAMALLADIARQPDGPGGDTTALEWLNQAVETFPQSAEARGQRARYFRLVNKDRVASLEDIEAALTLDAQDPSIQLMLANEWLSWGALDQAAQALNRVTAVDTKTLAGYDLDPDAWEYAWWRAKCQLSLLRDTPADAADTVDRAMSELRHHRLVAFMPFAIEGYLRVGQIDKARQWADEYREALRDRPDVTDKLRWDFALLEASIAQAQDDPVQVLNTLDIAHIGRPQEPQYWKLVWQAGKRTGQLRRAQRALEQYVRLIPGDGKAVLELARSYRNRDWDLVLRYAANAEKLLTSPLDAMLLRLEASIKMISLKNTHQLIAAASELDALRQTYPRNGVIRLLQAGIAYRTGKTDEAMDLLTQAANECEPDVEVDLAIVNLSKLIGNQSAALEACRNAVQRHPNLPQPWLLLAELVTENDRSSASPGVVATYEAASQTAASQEVLENGLRAMSGVDRIPMALALANQYLAHDNQTEALQLLEALCGQFPHDVRPRAALLGLSEVRAQADQSQRLIDELKQIEGVRQGVHWRLAQAKVWLERSDGQQQQAAAAELLQDCIRNDSDWPAPVVALGEMHERFGNHEAAETLYSRFLDAHPNEFEAASRLLQLLESRGRFTEAQRVLDRLAGDSSRFDQHRLQIALGQGDLLRATKELQQRIARKPEDATARVILARLVQAQYPLDTAKALELLDEAESIDPQVSGALPTRVAILHEAGRDEEAVALLDQNVAQTGDFEAYHLRARFLASLGRVEAALKNFEHLVEIPGKEVDGYVALAGFLREQDRRLEARQAYEQALHISPDDQPALRGLVFMLLSEKENSDHSRGWKLLQQLRQEVPDDASLKLAQAKALLERSKGDDKTQAVTLLKEIVTENPHDVPACLLLVEHLRTEGLTHEAKQQIEQATRQNPENLDLKLLSAWIEQGRGEIEQAKAVATTVWDVDHQFLADHPNDPTHAHRLVSASTLLTNIALSNHDLEEARRLSQEALRISPQSSEAQMLNAKTLAASGQIEQAINALQAFRQSDAGAENLQTLLMLSELYLSNGDSKMAQQLLDHAAAQFPDHSLVTKLRLRLLASTNQFDEIVQHFDQYLHQHPEDLSMTTWTATLLMQSSEERHWKQARTALERFAEYDFNQVEPLLLLAQARYRLGDAQTSTEAYRKTLNIDPANIHALNDLAWILANDLQQPEQALRFADRGILHQPDNPHLYDTRGVILYKLSKLTDSRQDLEKCLTLAPKDSRTYAKALFHLGKVLQEINESELARKYFTQAVAIGSEHPEYFTEQELSTMRRIIDRP